ncbi:MAG TPA: 50S ribosomal protein L29 [Patescibacteria group bacterium]|nr:50S ribosomal protein L29 [Patescibacteria group bacterium]
MKRNDINELRTKTVDELSRMALDLRNDAQKARTEVLSGKLKNTNMIKNKKKDLARVLTFLHMKKNEAGKVVEQKVEEKVKEVEKVEKKVKAKEAKV